MYRECLQKIIGFDKWHLSNFKERTYALSTVNRINELIQDGKVSSGTVLEIGCGLGDIISSIRWQNKLGYDVDKRAILAARILHPGMRFQVGSFEEIRNKKISVLIALNFLHGIRDEDCRQYFSTLFKYNEVDMVVVDEVQSPPYSYAHDWESLLGDTGGYVLEYKSRGYRAWEYSRMKILYFYKDKRLVQKDGHEKEE